MTQAQDQANVPPHLTMDNGEVIRQVQLLGQGGVPMNPWQGVPGYTGTRLSADSIVVYPDGYSESGTDPADNSFPVQGILVTDKVSLPSGVVTATQTLMPYAVPVAGVTAGDTWIRYAIGGTWQPWQAQSIVRMASDGTADVAITGYPIGTSQMGGKTGGTFKFPVVGDVITVRLKSVLGAGYQLLMSSNNGFDNSTYFRTWNPITVAWNPWNQLYGNPKVTTPALNSGFTALGGSYADPAYWMDSMGVVHIEGEVVATAAGTMFTLPVGFRPVKQHDFVATAGVLVAIQMDGQVIQGTTGAWTYSLDMIRFRTR